ncbi:GNAT family N-acetyltransferase [Alteribacter populi]|uniref:GNAT family N-acetyltransferase n=1 Tax=Alteribacter populi TaxID=2011011 RepID=UPI000BBAACB5|nr:GNAT family N-acetyltransferase [Alteribacter populi]
MLLLQDETNKTKDELIQEKSDLEFQMFRMQENIKKIAKRWHVLGIDQTKEDQWVILYATDDGETCKIMLHDCKTPFHGKWEFSIHAQYTDQNTIHIDDIRGEKNRGFGSVCIRHLKDYAQEQNIQYLVGDIAKRDWDHVDRLVHFYEKHHFQVTLHPVQKSGKIIWNPTQ